VLTIAAFVGSGSTATAATVTLHPAFSAGALGEGTTATALLTISGSEYVGRPAPVTDLTLRLPGGVEGSRTGLAVCEAGTLEMFGPIKCPRESLAGPEGSATLLVEFGDEAAEETASAQAYFGPGEEIYVFVDGHTPVSLEMLMKGSYTASPPPFGRMLSLAAPLVESVPGAPYASIVSLTLPLGASREEDGIPIPSITVPQTCPSGGFPWAASVAFENAPTVEAVATSPCLPAVAPPIPGTRQTLQVTSGEVSVRRPGTTEFVPLSLAASIPNGTEVDVSNGRAAVAAATADPEQSERAEIYGGRLLVSQQASGPTTTRFTLTQPLTGCPGVPSPTVPAIPLARSAKHRSGSRSRHLWVSEHGGSWGTDGRYVSTTVEGTSWLTLDECHRSVVKVASGRVRVHDLIRNITKTLTAGGSYVAGVRQRRR
jgi:hypothetical protein